MAKKTKKIKIETLAERKDIFQQPADKMLAAIIREQESRFRAAWSHYQTTTDDSEALHVLRVDLRRLRVWVKLTRREVSTKKPARKQLRMLAKASNPLRDHQVILGWLALAQKQLMEMPALNQLIAYGQQAYQQSADLCFAEKQWHEPQGKAKQGDALGQWLDNTVKQRIALIEQLLRAEMAEAHLARIEIKYLRYLLEPFTDTANHAKALVQWCKEIQGILGDFHDLQVFRSHLPEFARWVTDHELEAVALLPGKQARAITKVFANAREPIIALSGWQQQECQRQWQQWLSLRDDYLNTLDQLRQAWQPCSAGMI